MRTIRAAEGLLPIMNPLFNLREICKQSSLLEDHLNNERKRCPDCIRKHFLTIEALFEEAISLDKLLKHEALLQGKAEGVRKLQERWLDCQKFNDEKKNSALLQISQDLRKMRKEFAPLCFDTREMVSVEKQASLSVCPHRKKVATFILTAKDKQVISSFITRGHDLDGDYVSLVGGSLVTMTGRTLAIEDPEGDGFISPIGDYSLVDNKIISIVSRLADELGLEFGVEVSSGEDFRVRLASGSKDYIHSEDNELFMDKALALFNRGDQELFVDYEWSYDDTFWGGSDEYETQSPEYIKKFYLVPDKEFAPSDRYAISVRSPEYFFLPKYIPMLDAIIKGLGEELSSIRENYPNSRAIISALEDLIGDYDEQRKLLKRAKVATLSQTEKEDRSIESRIHKSPKNKPPRYDLRAKTKVEDPDLENLGGAAGGDRDLSMNHKKVASRFLRGQ